MTTHLHRLRGKCSPTGKIIRGIAVVFFSVWWIAGLGVPGGVAQDEVPEIRSIPSVPDIHTLPAFDLPGVIDRISSEDIVVDDSHFPFSVMSEGVSYYSERSFSPLKHQDFQVGDFVGCVLDDNDAVKELWKLKKSSQFGLEYKLID